MPRYMRVPAAVIALALLVLAAMHAAAVAPGNPAFQARWERTDDPVLSGQVSRTWIWGPEANTNVITEPYAESPGGQRQVQYFDKSRMEINNPDGDPNNLFYVTNGLLVIELMTGRLQLGDNTFENHNPAIVNVAGDADDPTGPTYLTMSLLRHLTALPDNSIITQRVDRAGTVTNDPSLAAQQVTAAYRVIVPGIDHQIASPFWTFMTSSGLVKVNGQYVNEALFTNPFYATGYPVTEAYWANVKVAGVYRDVLMQCFERRCLTYTPGNPAGFATEAGNVGQHYRTWRYIQIPAEVTPTATATATSTGSASATTTGVASATATDPGVATATSTNEGQLTATSTSTSEGESTATSTSTSAATATSTGSATPTETTTSIAPVSITVYNTGAFFVQFYVSYTIPDAPLQSLFSGVFNINQGVTLTVPGNATNVGVLIQGYTGITGWQTACTRAYAQATTAVIIISGTTFLPSCTG